MTAGLLLAGLAYLAAPSSVAQARPAIIAHRGLSAGLPENTLAAFRRSVERGVPVIELDVRATKDGHLVILHDATLDRTTNCRGRVADLTLARVRTCDAGGPTHPGERVPTLAEALELVGATRSRLLLDIKPGTSLDRVVREVRDHRPEAKVVLGFRRATQIARTRNALPNATLLAFIRRPADAAAFAKAGADAVRLWSDWVAVDPSSVTRLRSLGLEVWIMIGRKLPRTDSEWRALHARMLANAPDSLITDRPELVEARR